jgi:transcriptional regulator with PAS, ATPase and Fis domain
VVSATNVRLRQAMAEGRFREDLYYRLNVLSVQLPALRERRDDIECLARHFLSQAVQDFKREVTDFEPEALDLLRCHHWPGNVRELMSMVRRAVLISESGRIGVADLSGLDEADPSRDAPPSVRMPARPGSQAERAALLDALQRSEENITLTAHELGVSRVTLYRMLRRHRITLNRGLQEAPAVGRGQRSHDLITSSSGSRVG